MPPAVEAYSFNHRTAREVLSQSKFLLPLSLNFFGNQFRVARQNAGWQGKCGFPVDNEEALFVY